MNSAELLLRYVRDHSEEAFAEVVQKHIDFVYGWALQRVAGDRDWAGDVTQQVFITLSKNAHRLSKRSSLEGWLYLTTHYKARTLLRSEYRRQVRERSAVLMLELESSGKEDADPETLHRALSELLDKLSKSDREAILLRFFRGNRFSEIAAILGLTEDGARSRVDRAIDKMRRTLESRGIRSTSAALAAALVKQSLVAAPLGTAASTTAGALAGASTINLTVGMLNFMTKSKSVTALASVFAIFTVGAFMYKTRELNRAQSSLASEHVKLAALDTKVASLKRDVQTAESDNANAREAALARSGDKPRTTSSTQVRPISEKDIALRAGIEKRNYRSLLRDLNLSPAQIDAVTSAMAQNYLKIRAINSSASAQGIPLTDPSISAQRQQVRAELRAQLQAVLDPAAYQQVYEFSRTVSLSTETISWIAGNLSETSTPLTKEQSTQLTRILASHSANYRAGGEAGADVEWSGVIADASALLSPEQLAVLQQRRAHLEGVWSRGRGMPWTLP